MKHIIIYISIAFLSITAMNAQSDKPAYVHQAGFTAGTFFGIAPTYRYTKGNQGFQISALPVFNDGELLFNGSLGYIRNIARGENVDFSFVTSVSHGFTPQESATALNLGTQVEFKLGRYITLEARTGFLAASTKFSEGETRGFAIRPSGGVSVLYNFVND